MHHGIRYLYLFFVLFLLSFSTYAQTATCTATISPAGSVPICNGSTVELKANTGTSLSYQWYRNGAAISGATAATYTTGLGGEYKVQVSGGACTTPLTSEPTTVQIKNKPLDPNFTREPSTQPCSGTPVTFKVLQQEATVIYAWDFGDGTTGRGAEVSHTFTNLGRNNKSFTVKVVATLEGCFSDTVQNTITIGGQPDFQEANVTDSAGFQVCIPKDSAISVQAKLLNTIADPSSVTGYSVDFADGSGPQSFQPADFTATKPIRNIKPYTKQGTYPITIRAIGFNGCETVITKNYEVSQKPKAEFQIPEKKRLIESECTPVIVSVADSSKGGNLTYKWSVQNNQGQPASGVTFVEGTTDTSPQPKIQFNEKGRFQVQLIVENTCGKDTTSQSVLIAYPEVQMALDSTSCGPTAIKFSDQTVNYDTNLGTEVPNSFKWVIKGTSGATFVNGTSATSKFPEINFPNPGKYEISVSFANECGNSADVAQPGAAMATVTVFEVPRAPTVTASPAAICAGDSTVIKPTGPAGNRFLYYDAATGGTPLDSGGATYNTGPLNATTTYYITTLNANNCESPGARTPYTITVNQPIANNTIAQDQEVCEGSVAAPITGTLPTGGTGTYTYRWLRSTTGPDGGYTIAPGVNNGRNYTPPALSQNAWFRRLVTSAACSADTSNVIALTVTPRIAGNTISGQQQVCANEPVAPITGTQPTGGKPGALTIEWRSSTVSATTGFLPAANNNTEENYEPGTLTQTTWFRRYLISGGCADSSNVVQVTVDQPVANNSITGDQEVCADELPAPLTGSVPTGGTLPLRYRWESSTTDATAGFSPAVGVNNTQNFNPPALTVTTWFRRAILSGSCEPNYSNVVQLTALPAITNNTISTPETAVCEATPPKTITGSTPSGGNGTYTYLWESSITSATAAFAPAAGTNNTQNYTPPVLSRNSWFRRTITSGGCSNTSEIVEVKVNKLPPVPVVEAASVSTCPDSSATLVATGPGGTYQWFDAAKGGNIIFEGATFVTPAIAKTTTFYVQTVNQNQCASATRTPVTVNVATITASAGRDTTIIEGNTMELIGRGGVRYKWEPAAGLNDPNVARPVASPSKTTTYKVTAYSEEGCAATDEVTITVIPRIILVNTFSPNGDGINEVWEIQRIENFPEATVEIFNRWGTKVFQSSNGYQKAWDGKYNGQDLPLATYYYIIRLDKTSKPISGNVTLVR